MLTGSGTFIRLAKNVAFGFIDKVTVLPEGALRLKVARVMQRLENYCENAFLCFLAMEYGLAGRQFSCNEWSLSHR